MNTVGISHYLRMLKNAVEELRAGERVETVEESVEILLPVEALLPGFYIPDSGEKISMYQKLAGCEDEATLEEFARDLVAEYGALPVAVENLFGVLRLKLAARRSGVVRVKSDDKGRGQREIILTLSPRVEAQDIMRLLSKNQQWKISSNTLRIDAVHFEGKKKPAVWLKDLAEEIAALAKPKAPAKRKAEKGGEE